MARRYENNTRTTNINLLALSLYIAILLVNEVILVTWAVPVNSVLSYPLRPQDPVNRKYMKGREVLSNNALPGEPTCEELRAMWRYHKRQSRAELTNEIPKFGSTLFWESYQPEFPHQPHMSSFVPVRGRGRGLKLKNSKTPPAFGKIVYKPERQKGKTTTPRPMQQVAEMMGKGSSGGKGKGSTAHAVIHYTPPPSPASTTLSSFQQIKQVFREERMRDKNIGKQAQTEAGSGTATFGRIILGPPRGLDGRVANKPRELMTPFEKIRFGHADDLLDDGVKPMNPFTKRRVDPSISHGRVDNSTWTEDPYPRTILSQGRWGAFVPEERLDVGIEPQPFPSRTEALTFPVITAPSCQEIEGQFCQTNSDCTCTGFGLYRCFANQCQTMSFIPQDNPTSETGEDWYGGTWHSETLPTNKLGLWEPIEMLSFDDSIRVRRGA